MRALLVHNPTAGTGKHDKDSILAALRLANYDVRYFSTKSDGDIADALREPLDIVATAGGDGTVGHVLTRMADRCVPVAILPLGSANNISRSLGIAGSPQELAESWDLRHCCPYYLGRARGTVGDRLFIEAFGIGPFAELIALRESQDDADGANDLLQGRKALREILAQAEPLDVEITVDDQSFGEDVLCVEVLSIAYTGPGLPLASTANSADQLFDVVCITVDQRDALLKWLDTPQQGPAPVLLRQGARVTLAWKNAPIRVDDEFEPATGKRETVEITADPEPAYLLLPHAHPRAQHLEIPGASEGVIPEDLAAIEQMAVELANLAGAEIVNALGSLVAVRYKPGTADPASLRDPVSEIDHRVETLIRARLAERFPEHDIIGEEIDERPGRDHDFVWAVDPIDGTTNFVNGFPMIAASIGVLHRGRPVAGAIWCSVSHALRPGVYHAAAGGRLRFDGEDVTPRLNPAVRRQLVGVPASGGVEDQHWETRKTGSAAAECALVAVGLLQAARFAAPNVWDVAAGTSLIGAAGGIVRWHDGRRWLPLHRFEAGPSPGGPRDLRYWRGEIIVGTKDAVDRLCSLRNAPT